MKAETIKKFGRLGRRYPFLHGVLSAWSGRRATREKGGVTFHRDEDILSALLRTLGRVPLRTLDDYEQEVLADKELRETFDAAVARFSIRKYKDWADRNKRLRANLALYYGAVRELQPEVIVETGTATGSMTSYLLAALAKNKKGKLISIDLPPVAGTLTMDITVAEGDVGYYVPLAYRDRWEYLIGDAKELLPKVMAQTRVEMFIHDSLHTPAHMMFEYAVARALMPENGLVVSDDISWNDVFGAFLASQALIGYVPFGNPNIGAFVNAFGPEERSIGLGIVRRT